MIVETDTNEEFITQLLDTPILQTPVAPPSMPETADLMAAQHDHQVRSLVEVPGVPADLAQALLDYMRPYRPDLDTCQQWVDDLKTLDRHLPSICRGLRGVDAADQQPPTVGDLAMWISADACPAAALESTGSHIKAVLETTAGPLSTTATERKQISEYLSSSDFAAFVTEAHLDAANTLVAIAVADRYYIELQMDPGGPRTAISQLADLTRPIDPIVRAWQIRPTPATPDLRDRGIVPRAALAVRPRQGELFALTQLAHKVDIVNADPVHLPGMAPPHLPQTTPALAIFSAVGLSPVITRGRKGEAIDRRLLLEGLMAVPVAQRHAGAVSITLRTVRDWMWPAGEWHHRRDWPRLEAAFRSVNAAALPWEGLIDGTRQTVMYVPLTFALWPQHGELDGLVVIESRILPGGARGALVDRAQLRHYGATDALAWRIYLHAAHHWNEHLTFGGKLLSPTIPEVVRGGGDVILDVHGQEVRDPSGNRVRNWADPRAVQTGEIQENPAASRYGGLRIFTPDDLVLWAFPGKNPVGSTRREYRRRATGTVLRMHSEGSLQAEPVEIAKGSFGLRIFPPSQLYKRQYSPGHSIGRGGLHPRNTSTSPTRL